MRDKKENEVTLDEILVVACSDERDDCELSKKDDALDLYFVQDRIIGVRIF